MATLTPMYKAKDGKPFDTEIEAVKHEAITDLMEAVPALKISQVILMAHAREIAVAFKPLGDLIERDAVPAEENHPEPPVAETTLKPSDKQRWAVCSAIQNSDQMVCTDCELVWDVNEEPQPPCNPAVITARTNAQQDLAMDLLRG